MHINWYYLDRRFNTHGPFVPQQMADWSCYFQDDLLCRTSNDTEFHSLGEWKSVCQGRSPFITFVESFELARFRLFPTLPINSGDFSYRDLSPIPPRPKLPPLSADLQDELEREQCERLYNNITQLIETEDDDNNGEEEQQEQPSPPSLMQLPTLPAKFRPKKKQRLPRYNHYQNGFAAMEGQLYHHQYQQQPIFKSNYKATARSQRWTKKEKALSLEKFYEQRPAQQLLHPVNRPPISYQNPWGPTRTRWPKQPEDWQPFATTVPWKVSKSDNRFSIKTAPHTAKLYPTTFPRMFDADEFEALAEEEEQQQLLLEERMRDVQEHSTQIGPEENNNTEDSLQDLLNHILGLSININP